MKKQAKRTGSWLLNQYDQVCQKLKPGEVAKWKRSLSADNLDTFYKAKESVEFPSEIKYAKYEAEEALRLQNLKTSIKQLAVIKFLKLKEEKLLAKVERKRLKQESTILKAAVIVPSSKKIIKVIPSKRGLISRDCPTEYLPSGKMVIHLDAKTQIVVKAGRDPEIVKQAFLNRHHF